MEHRISRWYERSRFHEKNMHMFGAMYAPTDYLTLMIILWYMEKEMIQQRMAMSR